MLYKQFLLVLGSEAISYQMDGLKYAPAFFSIAV